MENVRDIIEKQKKRQELLKQGKENAKQKKKLEDLKDFNDREFNGNSLPKIEKMIIRIPERFLDLDKLDTLSIESLRDLLDQLTGKSTPHNSLYTKKHIIRIIKASFKTK